MSHNELFLWCLSTFFGTWQPLFLFTFILWQKTLCVSKQYEIMTKFSFLPLINWSHGVLNRLHLCWTFPPRLNRLQPARYTGDWRRQEKNAVGDRDRDKSVGGGQWECSAQLPVAVIDLKVNMVAGSEFWQEQPTVEREACPLALHVASHCALV